MWVVFSNAQLVSEHNTSPYGFRVIETNCLFLLFIIIIQGHFTSPLASERPYKICIIIINNKLSIY
jgi:hypothetical protein